jgi:hypothetical protein
MKPCLLRAPCPDAGDAIQEHMGGCANGSSGAPVPGVPGEARRRDVLHRALPVGAFRLPPHKLCCRVPREAQVSVLLRRKAPAAVGALLHREVGPAVKSGREWGGLAA